MIKKLKYITETLITPFIIDKYPQWVEFIRGYFQYLDENYYGKIINLTDNVNSFKIYSELLDNFLDTYFKDVINIEKFNLTDENKRIYISLSKFISGLKGNENNFNFLFKSLTNFQVFSPNGTIDIDKIAIQYEENETWWNTGQPYTYKFKIDQAYAVMKDLIESVHPAGFIFEFLTALEFEDEQDITDEITMTTTIIPTYSDTKFQLFYNNEVTYGGIELENSTF